MNIQIKPKRGFLTVAVSGVFDLQLANALIPRILDACAARRTSKLLIDARGVRGTVLLVERYLCTEVFVRLYKARRVAGGFKHVQFAFVADPPIFDSQRFGEKFATSRGLQFKSVSTVTEALAWLRVDLTNPAVEAPALYFSRDLRRER